MGAYIDGDERTVGPANRPASLLESLECLRRREKVRGERCGLTRLAEARGHSSMYKRERAVIRRLVAKRFSPAAM